MVYRYYLMSFSFCFTANIEVLCSIQLYLNRILLTLSYYVLDINSHSLLRINKRLPIVNCLAIFG